MESTITSKLSTATAKASNLTQKLSLDYWIGTPGSLSLDKLVIFELAATLVFAASFVLIAIRFGKRGLTPPENKFLSKTILYTIWFGPIGWMLVAFRNWGVVLLSARFWWLVWFLSLIFVVFWLWRSYKASFETSKQSYFSYQLKKRYFPKKKKKK